MTGHGTPEGYLDGCKTANPCPAVIPCRTVYIRYRGDLTFRKAFDAGTPLEQILVDDAAAAEADLIAEKEARRATRQGTHAPRGQRLAPPPEPRQRYAWTAEDDVMLREAARMRMSLTEAAEYLGRKHPTIRNHADLLGLTLVDGRSKRYGRAGA